jgi:hypothetical protein
MGVTRDKEQEFLVSGSVKDALHCSNAVDEFYLIHVPRGIGNFFFLD